MSTYTTADIHDADRLWDECPLPRVAERTGIPESTLRGWAEKGLIDTDVDHRTAHAHDQELIERADRLWDRMPLTKVSDLLGISYSTLSSWSEWGWIDTEADHRGSYQSKDMAEKVRRAAHLVHDQDRTKEEAAEIMEVSMSSLHRYLRLYRNGAYI